MRSKLFVPASRPELFAKAAASAADAVSFDLEDAVAEPRKDEARAVLAAHLAGTAPAPGMRIVIRINASGTRHHAADMAALVLASVDVINVPMVEEADVVRSVAAELERLETERAIRRPIGLLLTIETPRGLRRAAELAQAHPRVMGLQIGYADLLEPAGMDRRDDAVLSSIRIPVRLAAAEAGVLAYDGAFADIADRDGFAAECARARRQGFAGKSCIHPSQISMANAAFRPDAAAIARARRVLAAADVAAADGVGAFVVDGQMIDAPFVQRARAIVDLATRIDTKTVRADNDDR